MNYRHAFHAGNHGDVLKHLALVLILDALRRKPAPFAVLDTHAGRSLYDLTGNEAERSPEWTGGIGRLWGQGDLPAPLAHFLTVLARFNPDGALRCYPGSPALVAEALRERDELAACELHPQEYAALKAALRGKAGVRVHARDGWEALGALLPPSQRRGLVLIDPPYEAPGEVERAGAALTAALRRFRHGVYLWWRPLKSESALNAADSELANLGAGEMLRADLWVDAPRLEGKLLGSSLLIVNPPFGLAEALSQCLPTLADLLAAGQSGWRLR
ncbi:MAG: 23S rRNA (adenine(2030)-N(6))-methyltransferase RlmJ [Terricaulis sp.]